MAKNEKPKNEKSVMLELPATGLLRVRDVLQFVRVSRSSWWQGVKDGKFPQPIKLGSNKMAGHSVRIPNLSSGRR